MSALITTQTWQLGANVVIMKDDSWHGLPIGTKVQITSVQRYSDIVGADVPLSTTADPFSYGVTAVDPASGWGNRERFVCSDEISA